MVTTPRTCERCDTVTKHQLCDACAADEFEESDRDDESPEFEFDCGMLADGTCMLAGSEDCDWECPYGG